MDETVTRAACETCGGSGADDLRVPIWIVLSGVGVGAAWALIGVGVGYAVARRR